ncbi:WD40 repeat domain-containing protein [Streptomyces sp. NPDC001027]|uniref:WD40 repeat domain-containing protein n=1 Tax=Streptomyces sp. NPDC001027 TaxID=3154771 RepID=UPI00332F6AB0
MGRPERPVDPEAGPVQRLAHELRELRKSAGSPSYRTMAGAAGFSAASLSNAAAGKRLPSLAVVQGFVRVCGGDWAEWERRWKEAEAEEAGAVRDETEDDSPPYRGLARFEPDDRGLFFGRDRLVEELRELICGHRFAVMFGSSGSGKSSLLRAGLIPRLREHIALQGRPAVVRVLTPGAQPATKHGHLLDPAEDGPESWVLVDQFEEVFTLCRDPAERTRFIDMLLTARNPASQQRVVIAVRADFYAQCAEHRGLADALARCTLLVGPMSADELREAVVRPAQAVGILVERELTARIIEEVRDQPGALPMLSHALLETWKRRRSRLLTLATYEAAGGVHGAIAATAEEVYGQLSPDQAITARRLLLRLIEPGQGTADTRRPLPRSELDEHVDPGIWLVAERLARARLLTSDEGGVQLAHEALITCWPRLRGWVEEDRERLRHHRRLTEAARAWLEHDCDPGSLYRGARLARAEELFTDGSRSRGNGGRAELTATEEEFLAAALRVRAADRRAASRTTRRARVLLSALSAVLAVSLVVGLTAWQQHKDNQRQRTDAAARRIADVADALRTTDPRSAMLLGVAAWRVSPLPETRMALLGSLAQPEHAVFTDPAPGEGPTRFLTDSGRTLLSIDGRSWRTWNVVTGRRTGSGRLPTGEVLAAGPDTHFVAIAKDDGIRLWDRGAGRWIGDPRPLPLTSLAGIGLGRHVVSESDDGRVRLRSVQDGRVLFETRAPGLVPPAVSTDGRLLAICPAGGAPQLWNTDSRKTVPGDWTQFRRLCNEKRTALVFGGTQLAALSASGVRVWDTASGRQVADIDELEAEDAAFSPDGTFLATAGGEEIRVFRLSDSAAPVFRHSLNNQHLYELAWDPGDHTVLRYLEGGTVHCLDLGPAVTPAWRGRPLDAVQISPDGRTLATAERTGSRYRFELRATNDGHLIRALPSQPVPTPRDSADPIAAQDTVALLTFSPDGRTLTYGVPPPPGHEAAPQRFVVWDLNSDRKRAALDLAGPQSAGTVVSLASSTGGRTLYVGRIAAIGEVINEAWDTTSGRRTALLDGLTSVHLAAHPGGRLLIGDNRVVGIPSGRVTRQGLVQGEQVGALAFTGDGSHLAVGDQTGRVALWEGTLHHRSGVLRNVFPAPLGDTPEAVSALAISPDQRTLAVGGDAGTLQLWDIVTQQPLGGRVTTPGEGIHTLAFSGDSGTLYVGSAHVPLQRYTIAPDRAVTQVCARARGDLTRTEWNVYVPDAPYRRICG